MTQDNDPDFKTGAELLAAFNLKTREAKLAQAVKALMRTVNDLHIECKDQSLEHNLTNPDCFCSCADAYRMGHEALK